MPKDKCPTCAKLKDIRSVQCRTCSFISKPRRLGTGQDWHLDSNGYLVKCIYGVGKSVLQHRWIMEAYLGRKLEPDECVHHCNKIKNFNKIWNLELMLKSEHHKLHFTSEQATKLSRMGHAARWGKGE